jgi:drug/metabolite transporter (DMT)-like permease
MQRLEATSTSFQVGAAIGAYSLCSSTLLLANKAAMIYLPLPSVVSVIQIFSTTVFVLAIKFCGIKVDDIEWVKVKPYLLYIGAFVAAIFANMKALSHSNVETVIVFRACSPLAVTIVEYLWMGRSWPSMRSSAALMVVACGAIVYCLTDSELALNGIEAYYWVIVYFFLITFEMTYGKKLTSSVKMDSVWGPVLYCNLLALLPMFLLGYTAGDFEHASEKLSELPSNGWSILLFSCVGGTLIG